MSLIVRQLKEYSTNRSAAFAGTRCFLVTLGVNTSFTHYEVAVGKDLDNYYFLAEMNNDGPLHSTAAAIKRSIKSQGIEQFARSRSKTMFRWSDQNTIEMDWSNPPKVPMLAILVQLRNGGIPDFSAPALFMYVPEAIRKPRLRTRIKPLPKGTGPIPYRL
jgi:hypothetical protein